MWSMRRRRGHLRIRAALGSRFLFWRLLPLDLHCVDFGGTEDVGTKDHPLAVGAKCDVRLEMIVVLRQIDQLFRLESAVFGSKQIDPLTISGSSHAVWAAAIARKQFSIR